MSISKISDAISSNVGPLALAGGISATAAVAGLLIAQRRAAASNVVAGPKVPAVPTPVLYEKGGSGKTLNERIFVQLYVLDASDSQTLPVAREKLIAELRRRSIPCVVYNDISSPRALGLLVWHRNPQQFTDTVHPVLRIPGIGDKLQIRDGWTMTGMTYSSGYEADLEDVLIKKVPRVVTDPAKDLCVWYPMRREGKFYMENLKAQAKQLTPHAAIGRSYARRGVGDVRLLSDGIDSGDNEFIVGLVDKDLNPMSKLVADMRKTAHTSHYMKSIGPFFVGHRVFVQS